MLTKAFEGSFKGHAMFEIWEVDEAGNKVGDRPLFQLGAKKLSFLAAHTDELKEFVSKHQS